MSLVLQKFN